MGQTLKNFDIHAPLARKGAECLWSQMRATEGLVRFENYGGYYVAARFEDALAVLTKPTLFASGTGVTLPPPDNVRSFHIPAEVDPPAHREYRALMAPLLSASHARAMEPAIRAIARGLIAQMRTDESIDFVAAFARPLPILVALDLMGLPRSNAHDLGRMVDDLHREVATGELTGASERLQAYANRVVAERRATATDPNADVVSSIVLGSVFGRPLEPEEQMSMVRLLLVGGFDTTAIALATMMWWLARAPGEAERLRGNPAAIDLASEEIVRFSSPSTYLRRQVTEDTVLAGTELLKGDSVLVAFGAANHDPAKFSCPEQIVATRKPNAHIGFGAGHHRCVGSFLAKAQLRVAVEEILANFNTFSIDASSPIDYTTGLGQGIVVLPMIFARA